VSAATRYQEATKLLSVRNSDDVSKWGTKTEESLKICGPEKRSQYSDSLRTVRSGNRIPVEARSPTSVHTNIGTHISFRTIGTVSFTGEKRPRGCVNNQHTFSTEAKEIVELYLYSTSVPSWQATG
jgi:hypothetical protein